MEPTYDNLDDDAFPHIKITPLPPTDYEQCADVLALLANAVRGDIEVVRGQYVAQRVAEGMPENYAQQVFSSACINAGADGFADALGKPIVWGNALKARLAQVIMEASTNGS